uniref:Uncharacterized protein n=1 Tax=Strongyloides stercoralis TaxID=6248 RepID=A0A0K0ELX0_STRER
MLSNKPSQGSSTDSSNSESLEYNLSKKIKQNINCLEKEIVQRPPCDSLSLPSNNRQFIRHQLSATEEEHSSDDEESLVLRKKLSSKTKKDIHPLFKKIKECNFDKPPIGSSLRLSSNSIDSSTIEMSSTGNNTTSTTNPIPASPQKSIHNRFAGAHASFRIRMLQEQHGVKKIGEPVS